MPSLLLAHEPALRLGCFIGVLLAMAGWEMLAPRRRRLVSRALRWPGNLGIALLNTLLLRLVFPSAALGTAALAAERHWGLLDNISLPPWAGLVLALVALDLAIYLQHVMFHAVPALWRLHRVHHADLDLDVTTGARFHPLEILLSMGLKLGVVAALGASALAVLIFEIALNAASLFNHGNVMLPAPVERALRSILVTPDMHRIHHSAQPDETNSNFGFNLSWWDRLFGTYRAAPAVGYAAMTIGLDGLREPAQLRLDRMLIQPLIGPVGAYPINRRPAA